MAKAFHEPSLFYPTEETGSVIASPIRLLIAFDSFDGHCEALAGKIAEGVRSARAEAILKKVDQIVRRDFRDLDGLIMGSPVQQRGMSWPVKKFIDEMCEPAWFYDEMVGRVCGVFTTGGGHGDWGGGAELAQISMLANLAAMGCVIVPFPKLTRGFDVAGMHWGPHVRVTDADMVPIAVPAMAQESLDACFHHGAAIARVGAALKWNAGAGPLFDGGARFPSHEALVARALQDGSNGAQDVSR